MSPSVKLSAFLAYLLPVLGWLYVFIAHRRDRFAIYHTKQSIMLIFVAIGAFVLWLIFGWLLSFIPYAGAVIAAASFALIFALSIALIVIWIMGMIYAWQAKLKPIPMIGGWAERLPID